MSTFLFCSKQTEHITGLFGDPIGDKTNMITVGPRGPVLLQDVVYIDEIAHFDRERPPERVVHAKGAGAFGFFEVNPINSKEPKLSPNYH